MAETWTASPSCHQVQSNSSTSSFITGKWASELVSAGPFLLGMRNLENMPPNNTLSQQKLVILPIQLTCRTRSPSIPRNAFPSEPCQSHRCRTDLSVAARKVCILKSLVGGLSMFIGVSLFFWVKGNFFKLFRNMYHGHYYFLVYSFSYCILPDLNYALCQ